MGTLGQRSRTSGCLFDRDVSLLGTGAGKLARVVDVGVLPFCGDVV